MKRETIDNIMIAWEDLNDDRTIFHMNKFMRLVADTEPNLKSAMLKAGWLFKGDPK